MIDRRKLTKNIEKMIKEIEKIRDELLSNGVLNNGSKESIDYPEAFREFTITNSIEIVVKEMLVISQILVKTPEEIEEECKKVGSTPKIMTLELMREKVMEGRK